MTDQSTETAPTGAAVEITLDRLMLSPLNPRRGDENAGIDALAASLRTCGLLHNLAGIRQRDGKVAIVAGGRRLRALQRIAEEDAVDPATVRVPVVLAADQAEALRWAGAENLVRRPLHAAEEIHAFAQMAEAGAATETIASAFGTTVRHVRGRLRLAGLPEPILAALAEDRITLDVAAAYTVTEDPARALAVFEEIDGTCLGSYPREIRARLTSEACRHDDKLAAFVGRDVYEAAGGAVREDLFGEEVYFEDGALVARLAEVKLAEAANAMEAEGWVWASHGLTPFDYEAIAGRVYPDTPVIPEEDAARYEALAEAIESGTASSEEETEFEALQAACDVEIYTDAQRAVSGVHLTVGYRGELDLSRGIVREEELDAAIEAGLVPRVKKRRSPTSEGAGEKALYSGALAADLAVVRTAALQAALLAKPALALDLLTFVLTERLGVGTDPVGLSTDPPKNALEEDPGLVLPEALVGDEALHAPLRGVEAAAAFAACRERPKRQKNAMLTAAIARLVGTKLALGETNPMAEHLAAEAGLDVRAVWTPTEAFFSRLPKARLLEIYDAVMQKPSGRTQLEKQKKGDVARWLHLIFTEDAKGPTLTAEQRQRMRAWLPEGMAPMPSEPGEPEITPTDNTAEEATGGEHDAEPVVAAAE
ncbi:MAG: ParB N-terminal domain-containing protein [Pseudomonadota bacterium]